MISLFDIVNRVAPPLPWSEGDNIPWDDPEFSKRMLDEHLSQSHDLASRRSERIDEQIAAIRLQIEPAPARVLDLACGPGLYLSRLAACGYDGVGIDFSPASITHARSEAATAGHNIDYRLADLRNTEFGTGFHVVLLLYGQLNVFRRIEAVTIVEKAFAALVPGGVFIIEPQTHEHVVSSSTAAPSWSSHETGLFSPRPHILLNESFWDDEARTGTERFFVIDAATGDVTRHALSNEAYRDDELIGLLRSAGFANVELRPSLTGDRKNDGLCVVTGVRPA